MLKNRQITYGFGGMVGLFLSAFPVMANGAIADLFPADCVRHPGQENSCVPLLACFDNDQVLTGAAVGWREGTLFGQTSAGKTCTGNWSIQNTKYNLGTVELECTDGSFGVAQFTYSEGKGALVWGDGTLSDDSLFRAWAGEGLIDFLISEHANADNLCLGIYDPENMAKATENAPKPARF